MLIDYTVEDAEEGRYFDKSVDAKYYAFKMTLPSGPSRLKHPAHIAFCPGLHSL